MQMVKNFSRSEAHGAAKTRAWLASFTSWTLMRRHVFVTHLIAAHFGLKPLGLKGFEPRAVFPRCPPEAYSRPSGPL